MPSITELAVKVGLLIGLIVVAIVVATAITGMLRKRLLRKDDYEEEDDSLYTSARIEDLKSQGVIDEAQYARLKQESVEAGKRRAAADKAQKRKKSGLLD